MIVLIIIVFSVRISHYQQKVQKNTNVQIIKQNIKKYVPKKINVKKYIISVCQFDNSYEKIQSINEEKNGNIPKLLNNQYKRKSLKSEIYRMIFNAHVNLIRKMFKNPCYLIICMRSTLVKLEITIKIIILEMLHELVINIYLKLIL